MVQVINFIPRELAVFIGAIFGCMAFLLLHKDRYKSIRHLTLAYGDDLTDSQKIKITRSVFLNIGKNFIDVVRLRKYYTHQIKLLIDIEGEEFFKEVYNRGRGVIVITGHIGNFEILAAYFAREGYKVAAIGREAYDKRLNDMIVYNREVIGLVNIDTQDSPRRILKYINDGYAIGFLIDMDSSRVRGKFIPAYGRLSNMPVGQSVLGLKTGAGFVPMVCLRIGNRYKVVVKPEIIIERTDDFEADLYNITTRCAGVLEEFINEYKDQWVWMHNRWRTKAEK